MTIITKGPVVWFWSDGSAWGTVRQSFPASGSRSVALEVLHGSVRVERVLIGGQEFSSGQPGVLAAGSVYELSSTDRRPCLSWYRP